MQGRTPSSTKSSTLCAHITQFHHGAIIAQRIARQEQPQVGSHSLLAFAIGLRQTHQLQMQYESDEDVQRVSGSDQPWNYTVKDIQGEYEISATVDMKMIDLEYAGMKLDMLAKMMPLQQAGGVVFSMAANILDPDLAKALTADRMSPTAMERERADEYNAVSQIMSGIEAVKPMMANPQFRLQTIQQIMMDPGTMQRIQQDQVAQKRLQNRVEFFQVQVQQYSVNPQIGRTLSTTTFGSNAPVVSNQLPQ